MPAGDLADPVRALYTDHHRWLLNWLRRKLGCADTAADLAHDTFLRVLLSREASTIREPRAYLTTVAGRIVVNHFRRLSLEQVYVQALAALPEPHVPSPEDRAIILETLHEIDALLDGLAPEVRAAFLLSQLEGLTYDEIGSRLDISSRTVRRYMTEAFEQCIVLMC